MPSQPEPVFVMGATVAEAMAAAVGEPLPVAEVSRRLMSAVTVESVRELLRDSGA